MRKAWADRAQTLVFAGLIGLTGTCALLLPDRAFSDAENRTLAARPSLTVQSLFSGAYAAQAEQYVTDQFPLRDRGMAAHARLERARGMQAVSGVYFGRDGALYRHVDAPDPERLSGNAAKVEAFAAGLDIPVTLALIPSAAALYAENLPPAAPTYDQRVPIGEVYAQMSAAQTVDLWGPLTQDTGERLFYRTDHHWTSRGAYTAYRALAQEWGLDSLPEEELTPREMTDGFYGTLARTAGAAWLARDTIVRLYEPEARVTVMDSGTPTSGPLYDASMLETADAYRYFLGGSHALVTLEGERQDGGSLLLVRDSFADTIAPFFLYNFAQVHMVDLRYAKINLTEYCAQNEIDRVLILYEAPGFAHDASVRFFAVNEKLRLL